MLEKNKRVSKNIDKEDYITVLFHLGFPTKGGETNYYSGLSSKDYGESEQNIPCVYGCITIGRFDKIVYSAESRKEDWECINFNFKKVFNSFLKYGPKYYYWLENNNFASGPFLEC